MNEIDSELAPYDWAVYSWAYPCLNCIGASKTDAIFKWGTANGAKRGWQESQDVWAEVQAKQESGEWVPQWSVRRVEIVQVDK